MNCEVFKPLFPIQNLKLWHLYKKQLNNFWVATDFAADNRSFKIAAWLLSCTNRLLTVGLLLSNESVFCINQCASSLATHLNFFASKETVQDLIPIVVTDIHNIEELLVIFWYVVSRIYNQNMVDKRVAQDCEWMDSCIVEILSAESTRLYDKNIVVLVLETAFPDYVIIIDELKIYCHSIDKNVKENNDDDEVF